MDLILILLWFYWNLVKIEDNLKWIWKRGKRGVGSKLKQFLLEETKTCDLNRSFYSCVRLCTHNNLGVALKNDKYYWTSSLVPRCCYGRFSHSHWLKLFVGLALYSLSVLIFICPFCRVKQRHESHNKDGQRFNAL